MNEMLQNLIDFEIDFDLLLISAIVFRVRNPRAFFFYRCCHFLVAKAGMFLFNPDA